MKQAFWSRRTHKWLGLLVGIQAVFWMASGLYMTAISIEIIHGDHLSHVESTPLEAQAEAIQPGLLASVFSEMTGFRLKRLRDKVVYEVTYPGGVGLVDAQSGKRLDPLDQAMARSLALDAYQGLGELREIGLLRQLPSEVATRRAPLWRADFDDESGTTLYVSPSNGEVVAKRHTLWRAYDFLWMLHIMDYDKRSDINNTLLRAAAAAGPCSR